MPSVNQAYAMAIQEDSQRKLGSTYLGGEPLTMLAGRNANMYNNQGPGRNSHNNSQVQYQGQSSQGKRSGIICEHCGFKGNTKETCYRIVGFPTDFKSRRNGQSDVFKPQANNITVEKENNTEKFSFPGGYYSRDETLKMMSPKPTGSCKADAQAGMNTIKSDCNPDVEWIIDSGVLHHVTCSKEFLIDQKSVNQARNNKVQVPTGNRIQIEHIGDIMVLGSHCLKNILHEPYFKFNMLSVSKLTKDSNFVVSFYPNQCVLQ